MTASTRYRFQDHPFHLVTPSPWPICVSFSLFNLTNSLVLSLHKFIYTSVGLWCSVIISLWCLSLWFRDITSEASYLGNHTSAVQKGLNVGFILFIISEALFFMSIFWAYFHSNLKPGIELGGEWPPMGIEPINPFELPLLNSVLLLSSGATVTYSHHSLIYGNRKQAIWSCYATIILATCFTGFQLIEYSVSSFTLSDGIFGSCFFFGTGFHGLHVLIGTIFIGVELIRLLAYQLTSNHHSGFESSILYWHFVDIIWLILYGVFYLGGIY